eukprot:11930454-Ditylum_brightwellii.AAC.1
MFLLHSDRKRYRSLVADLANAHTCSKDKYPTTMTNAYKYLVDFQAPTDGVAEVVGVEDQDVAVEEAE